MRKLLIFISTLAAALLIWGCSQFADSTPCTTGQTLTQAELRGYFPGLTVICGDASYSQVNPTFAPKWHDYMGRVMSLLGSPGRWNERFDCNRFVTVKLAVIEVRYLVDTWNSWKAGQAPAAGECWYIPDSSPRDPKTGVRAGHAIVVTIENNRVVYRDIYSARELVLSPTELKSRMLVKF